jgi:hypothetical protein
MRKRLLGMMCLATTGCLHKYNTPLSANVPVVAGANQRYVDTLKVGYLACLPMVQSSDDGDRKNKEADRRGDTAATFDRSQCTADTKQDFQDAGLTLSDIYCEDFFRKANATARRRGFGRGLTNDVGGAVQAILGLAKVTTGVISGVGAGVAFADSTFRNYDESFMVDADLSRLRRLVNAAQDSMRLDFRNQDKAGPGFTIFTAESRIQRYAGLCSFLGMKNLLDASLADKTNQIEATNRAPAGDKNNLPNTVPPPAAPPAPVK